MKTQESCADFKELIILYCDGELEEHQRAEVETHLARCPSCRNYLNEQRLIWSLMDSLPGAEPTDLWPRISFARQRMLRTSRFLQWASAAAAALVLVSMTLWSFSAFSNRNRLPEPELLEQLDMVEEYASLVEVGGEDLLDHPDILNITFELSRR